MSELDGHNLQHDDAAPAVPEADRLITRIVDGVASDAERARFEELASRRPSLWRTLAVEQQSAGVLVRAFDRELERAERVELPVDAAAPVGRRTRAAWVAAGVGWAAAIVLAVVWAMTETGGEAPPGLTPVDLPPIEQLEPDDALQRYLDAPWVRGQMQPVLLEIEHLPDGTRRVWIMRRIEEFVDVPADAELPVNERNELTEEPAELRERTQSPSADGDTPDS